MNTNNDDNLYHQIETNLSNHIDDDLLTACSVYERDLSGNTGDPVLDALDYTFDTVPTSPRKFKKSKANSNKAGQTMNYNPISNLGHAANYTQVPNMGQTTKYTPNPNQSHTIPYSPNPNSGHTTPYSPNPNQGHTIPYSPNPNSGHTIPYSPNPNQGHTTPYSPNPNQGHTIPYNPNSNQGHTIPYNPNSNQGHTIPYNPNQNQGHTIPYTPNPNPGHTIPYTPNSSQGQTTRYNPYNPNTNGNQIPPDPRNTMYINPPVDSNPTSNISRAEYIQQAREACQRQLSDTIQSRNDNGRERFEYGDNAQRTGMIYNLDDRDTMPQKENFIKSFFAGKFKQEEDEEKDAAYIRALIIRAIAALALFLIVYLIDKNKMNFGGFSSEVIKKYVTGNDKFKELENLIMAFLKS